LFDEDLEGKGLGLSEDFIVVFFTDSSLTIFVVSDEQHFVDVHDSN